MKDAPSPEIAVWLRQVLEYLGVSSHDLANAAGIAPGTLRNLETGRHRASRQTATRKKSSASRSSRTRRSANTIANDRTERA